MDHLSDSGLEHARGLILRPHDVPGTYWTGDTALQLSVSSRDFYDVNVARDPADYCTYTIESKAYRLLAAEEIAETTLQAELRLDPCIGVWSGAALVHRPDWSCVGDLYCAGAVTNLGAISGDVYAASMTGAMGGQLEAPVDLDLSWPAADPMDFVMMHGAATVSPGTLAAGTTLGPYTPSRVSFCNGDLVLPGAVTIEDMLLVDGSLTIEGADNTIRAAKSMPAVYVTGDLTIRSATSLWIAGLVVVGGDMYIRADCADLSIVGGLFVAGELVETATEASGSASDARVYGRTDWSPSGGQINGAMEFSGADGYLRTNDSSSELQVANDYTLTVWMKPAATQKPWAGVISRCSPSGGENHWTLEFTQTADQLQVHHLLSPAWDPGITLAQLADGSWHHVAIVREGNEMRSYLDGNPIQTGPHDLAPGNGDGHLHIGADRTGLTDYMYTGLLDEVRIYNVALTPTQIVDVANHAPIAVAPMGYWPLDASGSQLAVTVEPAIGAVSLPHQVGGMPHIREWHWSPAAGAFYRNITRQSN
jgi:hypothetical protein